MNRNKAKLTDRIAEEQFGFIKGKGTRNALVTIRMLAEKAIEKNKDLYVCFIDYEKAFDCVRHKDLFNILDELDIDGKDMRPKIYWDQDWLQLEWTVNLVKNST